MLQSKRVDFEHGVFSAVFTGQTCMSRVIICYSVLSRIGLYIYLKIWTVIIFDVVLVCINARIFQHFMLGTVFRLCILVKNCH